jgi:cytoskeletal protein CcmA (bactofilin family)
MSEYNYILNGYEDDSDVLPSKVSLLPANHSRLINLINRQRPVSNSETIDLHVKGNALIDKELTVIGSAQVDTLYAETYADIQQLRVHGQTDINGIITMQNLTCTANATFEQGITMNGELMADTLAVRDIDGGAVFGVDANGLQIQKFDENDIVESSITLDEAAITVQPALISTGVVFAPSVNTALVTTASGELRLETTTSSIVLDDVTVRIEPSVITESVVANTLTAEAELQTRQLTSLPTFDGNGYAQWDFNSGTQSTENGTVIGTSPSSLGIVKYSADNLPASSIYLEDELMTLSAPEILINGTLRLAGSDKSVQDEFDDIGVQLASEIAGLISNFALDAAQQFLLTKLTAALLTKEGYEKLPDMPDEEDFQDSNSIPPIRLYPRGVFNDLGEAGEIIASRTNNKGKCTINADVLPTRVLEVNGDVLITTLDADDEFETQMTTRLATKVAVYDAQQALTNPQAVAVRLGTNSLVTTSGELQAAVVKCDNVASDTYNSVQMKKLVQRFANPHNRVLQVRSAKHASAIASLTRKVSRPRLSTDYSDAIVRLHDELTSLQRKFYTSTRIVQKDWSDAIVALHDKLHALQRSIQRAPLAKDWSSDIAELKKRANKTAVSANASKLPFRNYDTQLNAVRSDVKAVTKRVKPTTLSKNYDSQLTTVRADIEAVTKRVKPHVEKDYSASLKKVNDRVTTLATTSGGDASTVAAYTATLTTSDANNLKVRIGTVDELVITATATTLANDLTLPFNTSVYVGAAGSANFTRIHTATGGSYFDYVGGAGIIWRNASSNRMTLTPAGLLSPLALSVSGTTTLAAVTATTITATGTVNTGTLNVTGNLNVSGALNQVNVEQINVQDKVIVLASDSEGSLMNGAGIRIGFDLMDPPRLLYDTNAWNSSIKMNMPSLGVTGVSTLASVTVTALSTTGESILPKINLAVITDRAWSIYRAAVGTATSFAGGTIATFAGLSGFCTRFRCFNASSEGFVWENNAEKPLVAINGLSGSVNLCTTASLNFENTTDKQQISMYGPGNYGMGIQGGTLYNRSDNHFAWYKGGTHSSGMLSPGTGGSTLMKLEDSGTLTVPANAIISNVHIGRNLTSQGIAMQWNSTSYFGHYGQTTFINGRGLGSGAFEWVGANSDIGTQYGLMVLDHGGNLTINGNLNVTKDRNVFLNYDSYWGNATYATFGSVLSANVNLGYSFTAKTTTSRVELNCMYQCISGSGTENQDVMFFKPVIWANGNSGTPATATGNNLSGTRVNRDNPSVTRCERNFNTTVGTSYLILMNLYFQDQNDQFNLHIHGGTLRMI